LRRRSAGENQWNLCRLQRKAVQTRPVLESLVCPSVLVKFHLRPSQRANRDLTGK